MDGEGARRQLLRNGDDKVLSRQLTRESSAVKASSRILYYGGAAGNVPFRWESRPGTPKHHSSSNSSLIPPLTPPPSYQAKSSRSSLDQSGQRSKPKVVKAILSKLSLSTSPRGPRHMSPASSVSSSSSSSSSSAWSSSVYLSPLRLSRDGRRRNLSCTRFPLTFRLEDDAEVVDDVVNRHDHYGKEDEEEEYFRPPSPTSTLRFGTRRSKPTNGGRFRGCYPVKSVRDTLFSIIGHQGSTV